jgi:hypothetical protein
MDILREIFGDDLILGYKFPQRQRWEELEKSLAKEEDSLRKYVLEKLKLEIESNNKDFQETMDMNPNGFWECAFSVQGIRYLRHMRDELNDAVENPKIVKVVSQGLLSSDVRYIDRIIFLIRNPRSVAKSQERLKREILIEGADGEVHNLFENMVIHSPEMFIQVSIQALMFMQENKDIPIQFIEFEDLIANPEKQINKIVDFVPLPGNAQDGIDIVEPKLNRSEPEEIENDLWEDAEYVYEALLHVRYLYENQKLDDLDEVIEGFLEYMQDPKRDINKKNTSWRCYRAKEIANYDVCQRCINDRKYRENMKLRSEAIEAEFTKHWSQEPCQFECGKNPDTDEYITVEESIANNFWLKG